LVYGEHDYPQSTGHTSDFYNFIMPKSPGDFKCQMKMVENEGHVPFISLYEGLRFIFAEWKFPDDRRAKAELNEIKQHFGKVAKKYNYKPVIPEDILIGLGYRLIRQGKITEAVEALLFACQIHPYSPDAFYYLGEAYEKNNQIDLALKNYKKALEVDSSYLIAVQKIQSLEKKDR
jgi:tetratricopeptide (TPR) repeat protein